jgi:hypothetical protein
VNGRAAALVLALVPLLLSARDPVGDVAVCGGASRASGPDLIEATGRATELGTVATWRLTFDRPVEVPSALRIDIVVRDPRLPAARYEDMTGLNRLVRWRAVSAEEPVKVVWLPNDGSTTFNPPVIERRTVEIAVPGRMLLGERPDGTQSVARARWGVVVRSGGACDVLADGKPVLGLAPEASPPPQDAPGSGTEPVAAAPDGGLPRWPLGLLIVLAALSLLAISHRRRSTGSR